MREWIDELSDWIERQDGACYEVSEEAFEVAAQTDDLLEVQEQLELAYSQLLKDETSRRITTGH
jgi:hypothetical protein